MLKILYKGVDFMAFDKPYGMRMHEGDEGNSVGTFLEKVTLNYGEILHAHEDYPLQKKSIDLRGIVNRLDRDTSGIVLVALTNEILHKLRKDFTTGNVTKTYIAVVHGHIKEESSIVSALGREKKGFKRLVEGSKNARGPFMNAETHVLPIAYNKENDTTTLLLTPKTGRTHQLRAHLSSINHPIVGDILYGKDTDKKEKRLYLHANALTFSDGITITSPCPWQEPLEN